MKLFKKGILAALSAMLLSLVCLAAACGGGKTVGYTVEVYLAAEDGYTLSAENSKTGSGEAGSELTLTAPVVEGYVFAADHEGNVTTLTLSEDESANVFKFYYQAESAEGPFSLSYSANTPRGMAASGSMAPTVAESGKVTAAESAFSVLGYRFSGWSYDPDGDAEVQPGDAVDVTADVTLYAVWERGYVDRLGGSDFIYPTQEGVILQRGGVEFEGTAAGDIFTFTLPDGNTKKGRLFDDYSFAYAQEGLAGTYTFHSLYFNKDDENGEVAPDPSTTLTIDEYGTASFSNAQLTTPEKGYVTIYSYGEEPEYLFVIENGENAGSGFIFRFDRSGDTTYFSITNGEAGTYTLAETPDGYVFYGSDPFGLYLDGYGGLILTHSDYTGEWAGRYWIDNMFDFTETLSLYKLHLLIVADNALSRLHGGVENGLLSITCYTMPLSEDEFVYVEPNAEAGEYTNGDGSTLVLDGFKNFADSAIYTLDGATHYGAYEAIWSQTENLTIVMHENALDGTPTGRDYTFKIDIRQYMDEHGNPAFNILDSFSVLGSETFASYRHLGGTGYEDEVIRISTAPYEGVGGAYIAEYGTVSPQGGYTKIADGYVTGNTMRSSALYTFTRTSVAADVPKSMIFQLASAYDSNYFLYDIYFVFSAEYDDATKNVQSYAEITDAKGSDAKIWYAAPPTPGMLIGTVYFDAAGRAQIGSFSTVEDYFGNVGILTLVDSNGNTSQLYFDLEFDEDGNPATFVTLPEREYELLTMTSSGSPEQMVHYLVRGSEGMYSASGEFGQDVVRGTVQYVGETDTGETIMAFVNSEGIALFRYVVDTIVYYEPGFGSNEYNVYYSYNASFDKTYTSDEGTLKLDGFRSGVYTDAAGGSHTGTYTLSADGKIVYLNADTRYVFDVSEGLERTDGVYGTYAMFVGEWWDVNFDGHGHATASLGSRRVSGIYRTEGQEVLLFINIGDATSYRLRLTSYEEHGEAAVFDENLSGAFIGDDWTVLYLDGYSSGSYYYPDGSGRTTVYYDVLDEEIGYVNIRDTNFNEQNVILNTEKKTMSYPHYAAKTYTYYGEDLSALIIESGGMIYMNYTSGYYILADGVYRAYLLNSEAEYEAIDLGSEPADGVWTVNGKKYFPYAAGQTVTLTGTVEGGLDGTYRENAALTFPLTGDVIMEMRGSLTVGTEVYSVDLVSSFFDGTGRHGLAVVDWTQYEYSALTEYQYNGNGAGTFRIVVAEKTMTMVDGFEREDGITSTLTETRVGFGPISFAERKLSGHIYVGGGNYFDFADKDIETTYYFETDQGPRYNVIFEVGGTTYSMQYNKEDYDYRLYLIGTYQRVAAGDYTVGVVRYFYSNKSYTFTYSVGDICDAILYSGSGADAAPIVAMSKNFTVSEDGTLTGWYLDIGGYDPVTERGETGKIYTVTLDAAAATVKGYAFMQAADEENGFYANLCLGEDNSVEDIVAITDGASFRDVTSFTLAESSATAEVYNVTLSDGALYRLTLHLEGGKHLTNTDGSWQMTFVEVRA